MRAHLRDLVVAAVILLALDSVWLVVVAGPLYRNELGARIAASPDLAAGALFYVGYLAALWWFAIRPGVATGSARTAGVNGAVLGLAAYGTWALTNKAVLAGWPWALVPVDIVWGGLLSAVTAAVTTLVARRVDRPRAA